MEGNNSTKTKLIKAGIKLFSQYGYAATSTRMIASEAEVNLSAIAFHYSNEAVRSLPGIYAGKGKGILCGLVYGD